MGIYLVLNIIDSRLSGPNHSAVGAVILRLWITMKMDNIFFSLAEAGREVYKVGAGMLQMERGQLTP